MFEPADITAYKLTEAGTTLQIHFKDINLAKVILDKHIRKCGVWLDDGRTISAEQRKKAYATIADISKYTGDNPEWMKEYLKSLHMARTGCDEFSLSSKSQQSATMDEAREFINTIMDFAIEHGVILDDLGINRTDDINRYIYCCIKHKKCAVCGRNGEIHHWDAIGMGNDRTEIDDSQKRKICLCRVHHTECHTIGNAEFEKKHKVYGIIIK